jgi:hypothetical protein
MEINRLDDYTNLSIFHMLIKLRCNYDNNLNKYELYQYNSLCEWYDNYLKQYNIDDTRIHKVK